MPLLSLPCFQFCILFCINELVGTDKTQLAQACLMCQVACPVSKAPPYSMRCRLLLLQLSCALARLSPNSGPWARSSARGKPSLLGAALFVPSHCFSDAICTERCSRQLCLPRHPGAKLAGAKVNRCSCPEHLSAQITSEKQQQCNERDFTSHSGGNFTEMQQSAVW